jgi:hypothetical protein
MPRFGLLALLFVMLVPACGGKILDVRDTDPEENGGTARSPSPEGTSPPGSADPSQGGARDRAGAPNGASPNGTSPGGAGGTGGAGGAGGSNGAAPQHGCDAICDRDTRCITDYDRADCVRLCFEEEGQPGCGALAKTWHACFAANASQATCSAGPFACRESYCAYLACLAPERTSKYCM